MVPSALTETVSVSSASSPVWIAHNSPIAGTARSTKSPPMPAMDRAAAAKVASAIGTPALRRAATTIRITWTMANREAAEQSRAGPST